MEKNGKEPHLTKHNIPAVLGIGFLFVVFPTGCIITLGWLGIKLICLSTSKILYSILWKIFGGIILLIAIEGLSAYLFWIFGKPTYVKYKGEIWEYCRGINAEDADKLIQTDEDGMIVKEEYVDETNVDLIEAVENKKTCKKWKHLFRKRQQSQHK